MYSSRLEKTSNVIHLYICLQQSAICSKEQQYRAWHKYTALPARAPHGHLLTCRHTLRSKKTYTYEFQQLFDINVGQ